MRENAIRITRFLQKTIIYTNFQLSPPEPVFFKDYFRFLKSVLAQTGPENLTFCSKKVFCLEEWVLLIDISARDIATLNAKERSLAVQT